MCYTPLMKRKPASDKEISKALDMLDAMGHEKESEGIKWTKQFMKEFDNKQWEHNQLRQEELEKGRRTAFDHRYFRLVASMLNEEAHDLDLPTAYMIAGYSTKKGVVLEVIDRHGIHHRRAFTPSGIPKIDYHCVVNCLIQAQNTIDKLERLYIDTHYTRDGIARTASGILLHD